MFAVRRMGTGRFTPLGTADKGFLQGRKGLFHIDFQWCLLLRTVDLCLLRRMGGNCGGLRIGLPLRSLCV